MEKKKVLEKKVKKRNYLVQRIEGLPKKMVTPGKEEMIRIKNEQVLFDNMRSVNSDSDYFIKIY